MGHQYYNFKQVYLIKVSAQKSKMKSKTSTFSAELSLMYNLSILNPCKSSTNLFLVKVMTNRRFLILDKLRTMKQKCFYLLDSPIIKRLYCAKR